MNKESNKDLKNLFIGVGVILLYLISSAYIYNFIELFGIKYNSLSKTLKSLYIICYESILTLIIIYIYKKNFIPNLKDFKKNLKKYIDEYIKYWFLMLGLMFLSNLIITNFTTTQTTQNQQNIISLLKEMPLYIIFSVTLISPFLEELVFRLSFRKIFAKTNWLFVLFSGIVFGSMHVIDMSNNLINLLFIIPYSIPGCIFAYTYTKSKNICVPISLHLIHNTVMLILQIIVLFK